jgi:hypothetical protein
VANLCKFGRNYGKGGRQHEHEIILQFNNLFTIFKEHALKANGSEMSIESVRRYTFLTSANVNNYSTTDSRI